MAKGQMRSNKEARKPKATKPKKTHGSRVSEQSGLTSKDSR
jgi:hypothetical protein